MTAAQAMRRRLAHAVNDVAATLSAANASAARRWAEPDRAADRRLLAILGVAALSLFLMHYLAINVGSNLPQLLWSLGMRQTARDLHAAFADPGGGTFLLLMFWAAGTSFCLLVLPVALLLAIRQPLGEYGFRLGHGRDARIYLLLFAIMLPLVGAAAATPGFRDYYPFYKPAAGESLWPRFAIFEAGYVLHFLAIEFFFRGLLIHGAKHRFGAWAILLPLIPYMMIHFGKPAGEAAGSVIAGLVLGYLSLRTGSIMYGVLLHVGVALTMDLTALWLQGRLF